MVLSEWAILMSHTQVHHFYAWTHLQIPTNTINIFFSKYVCHILWHTSSLMWWYMEHLWPPIHLSRWLQIWLIYCIYCTMSSIIVTLLAFTIELLINTINMWLISYQFTIFLIKISNHFYLPAELYHFAKGRLSQQVVSQKLTLVCLWSSAWALFYPASPKTIKVYFLDIWSQHGCNFWGHRPILCKHRG